MASFDKYSNYDENTSFSSVIFGAEKPVLEVELNEMQQIITSNIRRLCSVLGAGFYPISDSNVSLNGTTLTIIGGLIITPNGLISVIGEPISVTVNGTNPYAYFEVSEIEVTKDSVLHSYGNTAGAVIDNKISDPRMTGVETTRRKAIIYTLKAGVKGNLTDVNYVGVGTYENNAFTLERAGLDKIRSEVLSSIDPVFTGSMSLGRKSGTTVGTNSIALGYLVTASGVRSIALGYSVNATGETSFAVGRSLTALQNQFAFGHYTDITLATQNSLSGKSTGTVFVLGNGTSSAPSNAFRVTGDGATFAKGAYNATGADYAEYSEWADGNPDNEDRRGYFVTFDEEKPNMIRKANTNDVDILGVVSGNPCIIGNSDECWLGKNLFDDFGSPIYEEVQETIEVENEETGEIETKTITVMQHKVNPDFDPTQKYVHRKDRKEWSAVGWIGVLAVREDGTCEVGGYCTWNDDGIATSAPPSRFNYRVIERVNDSVVKVVIK